MLSASAELLLLLCVDSTSYLHSFMHGATGDEDSHLLFSSPSPHSFTGRILISKAHFAFFFFFCRLYTFFNQQFCREKHSHPPNGQVVLNVG